MTKEELEAFADAVCKAEEVPTPRIKWRWTNYAHCYHTNLLMPTPEYVAYVNGEPDPERLRMLLLHELSHWVSRHQPRRASRKRRRANGIHGPQMYSTLFRLAEKWGFDLDEVRAEEQDYMPNHSAAGWRLYQGQRGNTANG